MNVSSVDDYKNTGNNFRASTKKKYFLSTQTENLVKNFLSYIIHALWTSP